MSDNIENTPTTSYIDISSRDDRVAYLTKMNAMRTEAINCDWVKDSKMDPSAGGYKYLSTDKIKKNLSPLFAKHKLELVGLRFYSPINHGACGRLTSHWTIMMDIQIADAETGYVAPVDTVVGEAADSLDKGLSKACTYALKNFLTAKFLVVDGIDPDADPLEDAPREYIPQSDAEKKVALAEVKSKALEAKEAPKAEAPKKVVKAKKTAEPAPVAPAEEKPAEPVAEAPKEEPKAELPQDDKPETVGDKFKLTDIQIKTLKRKFKDWSQAYQDGKIKESTYLAFVDKYKHLGSSSEVIKLSTTKIADPAE